MQTTASAELWCDGCEKAVAAEVAATMRVGSGTLAVCPTCRRALVAPAGRAHRVSAAPSPFAPRHEGPSGDPLPRVLVRAFGYPFRLATLAAIGGLAAVSWPLLTFVPLAGIVLAAAIQLAFLFQVVRSTAVGADDWTVTEEEGNSPLEWLPALARYLGATMVAFGPALMIWMLLANRQLALLAAVVGVLYMPAAIIAASYKSGGCIGPLNPIPALVIIGRIPGPYAITVGFLGVVAALGVGLQIGVAALLLALRAVPVLPSLLAIGLMLVPAVTGARMLGLLVREHGDELFGDL